MSNWSLTDVGLSFRWQRLCECNYNFAGQAILEWSTPTYQLQVARDESFGDVWIDVEYDAPSGRTDDIANAKCQTEAFYLPPHLPESGDYYWRVRAIKNSFLSSYEWPWSSTAQFTITTDRVPVTSHDDRRKLSPESPLFTFDLYGLDSGNWGPEPPFERVLEYFPEDVQDFVALAVGHEYVSLFMPSLHPSPSPTLTFFKVFLTKTIFFFLLNSRLK